METLYNKIDIAFKAYGYFRDILIILVLIPMIIMIKGLTLISYNVYSRS